VKEQVVYGIWLMVNACRQVVIQQLVELVLMQPLLVMVTVWDIVVQCMVLMTVTMISMVLAVV
jgi:hypothetical protein